MLSENIKNIDFTKEWKKYIDDRIKEYIQKVLKMNKVEDIDQNDFITNRDFQTFIENDLYAHNFSFIEVNDMYRYIGDSFEFKESTICKLLAYFYQLYDNYSSVEDLKRVIDSSYSNLEDFNEVDLQKIFESKVELKF